MKAKLFAFKHVLYADNGYAVWHVKTGELIFFMSEEDYYLMQVTNTPRRRYLREQLAALGPPPREFTSSFPFVELEYLP